MPVIMILTEPMEEQVEAGLDVPAKTVLGPFQSVTFVEGTWCGDGERVAEVFMETSTDMMHNVMGHPSAGKVFVPRTFSSSEHGHPDYPGKGYGKVEVTRA